MQQMFVQETIISMNSGAFDQLKLALIGEYIHFQIITPEKVSKEILAEKVLDYFEKFQYKTGKKYEDLLKSYMSELDSLVEPHVAKTPQVKKNEPQPVVPRSRKFYEKAVEIKKALKDFSGLVDYTRLMLCLYAAIINSDEEKITNLDFSINCLNPDALVAALKNEKESALFGKKNPKPRFDTSNPYTTDCSFFVMVIILLYTIIGDSLKEDLANE